MMAVKPCSVVLDRKEVEAYFTHKKKASDEAVWPETVLLQDSPLKKPKLMTGNTFYCPPGTANSMSYTPVTPLTTVTPATTLTPATTMTPLTTVTPLITVLKRLFTASETTQTSTLLSKNYLTCSKKLKSSVHSKPNSKKNDKLKTKVCQPEFKIVKTNPFNSSKSPLSQLQSATSEIERCDKFYQESEVKPSSDMTTAVSFKDLEGVKLHNNTKKSDLAVIAIHSSSKSVNTKGMKGMEFIMYTAVQIVDRNVKVLRKSVGKNSLELYADLSLPLGHIKCQICFMTFKSSKHLADHIRNIHCLTYQCITCRGHPGCLQDLASHLCNKHGAHCSLGISYYTTNELLVHGSESSYFFTCLICNNCTSNTSIKSLLEHVSSEHHLCKICGSNFLFASDLLAHTTSHLQSADTFNCSVCHAAFRRYKHLQYHFKDNVCNNMYEKHILTRKSFIRHHISSASTSCYQCPYCNIQMKNYDIHFLINHISCHEAKICSVCTQSYITISVSNTGSTEDIICESCIMIENLLQNPFLHPARMNCNEFDLQNKQPNSNTEVIVVTDKVIDITINWTECDTQFIHISISKLITNVNLMAYVSDPVYHFCKYCKQNINVEKDLYNHVCESHSITFDLHGISNESLTFETLQALLHDEYNAVNLKIDTLISCIGKLIDLEIRSACSCLYCNRILSKSYLFEHVSSMHPTCRTCCQLFCTTQEFKKHISNHANGAVKFYRCLRCSKLAKSLKSFINHFHENHTQLEEKKSVDSIESLYVERDSNVRFACPYCLIATDSESCFTKHLSLHYMEHCRKCNEEYVHNTSSLKNNIISHDCSVLNKNITSRTYDYLKNLVCLQIQPKNTILIENKNADGAQSKIEIYLPKAIQSGNEITSPNLSTCVQTPILNKKSVSLRTESQLKCKAVLHKIDAISYQRISRTANTEQLVFRPKSVSIEPPTCCLFCKLNFASNSEFVAHVSDVHYVCRICNVNFQNLNYLHVHNNLHIKGLIHSYACKICYINLKSYSAMQKHCEIKQHEFVNFEHSKSDPKYLYSGDERLYKCPYCSLNFQLEIYYLKHVKCHKIVSCDKCNKKFVPSLMELISNSVTSKTCYHCLENFNNETVFTDSSNCFVSPTTKFLNDKINDVLMAEGDDETTGMDFCTPFETVTVNEQARLIKAEDAIVKAADNTSSLVSTFESLPLKAGDEGVAKVEPVDASNFTNNLQLCGSTMTQAANPVVSVVDSQKSLDIFDIKVEPIESDEEMCINGTNIDFKEEVIMPAFEECDMFNGCIFQTKVEIEDKLDLS